MNPQPKFERDAYWTRPRSAWLFGKTDMHFVVLGLLTSIGYVIILVKMLGWRKLVGIQVPLDIAFTVGLPVLFGLTGTITGLMVAIMAGLWFSGILFVASWFVKPLPLIQRKPKNV